MRVSWFLLAALLVVGVAQVLASPLPSEVVAEDATHSGSKTWSAVKQFFLPVTDYFSSLPSKTPSDVGGDIKEKVVDFKEWAKENDAIQGLVAALKPVKTWVKDTATELKDKTFRDMVDDVKHTVKQLDDRVGTLINDHVLEE